MTLGLKIAGTILAFLAANWWVTTAFELISSPSDFGFIAGIMMLLGLVVVSVWLATKFKKYLKNSNRLIMIVMIGAMIMMTSACSRVDPGHVGIKVNYYGEDRGVDSYPIVTGFVWYNPVSSTVFEYPTYVQTAVWTKDAHEGNPVNEEITFNSKEGLIISGDISLAYRLDPEKVPAFYVKFRSDDINQFTHGFLRNIARDSFNEVAIQYTVEETYTKKEELLNKVRERINSQVSSYGVVLEQFGFIGAPRIPDAVMNAINGKIQAIQDAIRIENEIRQEKASAQKAIAKAEGEARSNEVLTRSITDSLLRWRQLQITEQAVQKWDGKRPMIEGNSSGLLLNITPPSH